MTQHLCADHVVDIEAGTRIDYDAKYARWGECENCPACTAIRESLKETQGRNRRDRIVAAACAVEEDMECICAHDGYHCRFFVETAHPEDCEDCTPQPDPDYWRD